MAEAFFMASTGRAQVLSKGEAIKKRERSELVILLKASPKGISESGAFRNPNVSISNP